MATILFANNATSTLAGSITNTATTANLASGSGSLFPNPSGSQYFVGSFTDAATGLLHEIVWVTNVTTDTITMVRAQEGTTAQNWNAGDIFANLVTAGTMQTVEANNAAAVPSGAIQPFAGNSAPSGWLLCYGQAVSRTTYSALFGACGTTFGAGDGSTTFNLPDLRGRSVFGLDNMGGSAANRITSGGSNLSGVTLGATGGDQNYAQHSHGVTDPTHDHSFTFPTHGNGANVNDTISTGDADVTPPYPYTFSDTTGSAATGISINNAGIGNSANVPPAMIVLYIIKT